MINRRFAAVLPVLLLPMVACGAQVSTDARADSLFRATQEFWTQQIAALGGHYRAGKVAQFNGPAKGLCDVQGSVVGSFYCPSNETVYLDDAAIKSISARTDADVAGYVIGHEVAHHIQYIIGTTAVVQQARLRSAPQIAGRTFVTFELQADCYTGLWLQWAKGRGLVQLPDATRLLTAMAAAESGKLAPEEQRLDPLGEGSAAQRQRWLQRGLEGQFNDCDTFAAQAAGKL